MARGYPDFFGYPVHPEYGTTTKKAHANVVVGPGTTHTLLDLHIKGRIAGGLLYTAQDAFDDDVAIDITIDNVPVAQVSGLTDDILRLGLTSDFVIQPIRIDHSALSYFWRFAPDVLVNFSLLVVATNNEAVNNYLAGITLFYNGYEAP